MVYKKKKKGRIKTLLGEIDDAYLRFKMNSSRCEAELYRFKNLTLEELKRGKIDEQSYNILKERIEVYLHEIHTRA